MRPRDMAKFGLLFLNRGEWRGKRIVSKSWVDESTQWVHQFSDRRGHGYLWWLNKWNYEGERITSFTAAGNGGQYIMVFPTLDMVVVFTGGKYNSKLGEQPFQIISQFVLPAAARIPVSTAATTHPGWVELAYHDGTRMGNINPWSENSTIKVEEGVKFTPSKYPSTIREIRFFVFNNSGSARLFNVHGYKDCGDPCAKKIFSSVDGQIADVGI